MNPDRDRAVEIRRRAIADQIEGLERMVATGASEAHLVDRLEHTRAELVGLEVYRARHERSERRPARENPRRAGPRGF